MPRFHLPTPARLRPLALALALASTPLLAGDTIGTGDSQVRVPAHFTQADGTQAVAWSLLGDAALPALVQQAMQANTDVRKALARLALARAGQGAARADALPQGGVDATRQSGRPEPSPWAGSVELSWEIDLFGRQARRREGARARAEAAAAELAAVQVAVASEVARAWFQLQGAREVLALRQRSLRAQEAVVDLVRDRVELGDAAPGDLARSRSEAAAEAAELEQARDTVFALEARLALLLGEPPGTWRAPPPVALAPLQIAAIAVPDPAALLQARPDVRAAERALAARAADARAAAAARFPSLHLGGLLGFLSGDLSGLFSSSADTRTQGGTLSWGLLSLPRVQAQYRAAQAESGLALAEYEAVVLRAIEETEVALQRHGSASERLQRRLESAAQAWIAAEATLARYEEGAAPYLDALFARRDALAAELAAVEALTGQRIAVIDVLRALGTAPAGAAG